MNSRTKRKLKIGVFKFASCDGCQLSLLDLEDELLMLADSLDIAFFPELSSRMSKGTYDIGLVEGSITTTDDAERIQQIRRQCKKLITIGACASAGGIQALRNWHDSGQWVQQVYPKPEYISTLTTSTPISEHVVVDFELRGCPVNKHQLLEVLAAAIVGRKPNIPAYSVCIECKRRGTVCLNVAHRVACLGPATQAGCGAICPAYNRGCYGCFGPMETSNTQILSADLLAQGNAREALERSFRTFNPLAGPFRQACERKTSA